MYTTAKNKATKEAEMKKYRNENDTMRVGAYEKDGRFCIVIEEVRKMLVATKGSRKAHIEEYISHFEKCFDTADQANRYFLGIKKNNPTLKAF